LEQTPAGVICTAGGVESLASILYCSNNVGVAVNNLPTRSRQPEEKILMMKKDSPGREVRGTKRGMRAATITYQDDQPTCRCRGVGEGEHTVQSKYHSVKRRPYDTFIS
jgi:hypothetical protein